MISITTEPSQTYPGQLTVCFDADGGGDYGSGTGAACSDGTLPMAYTDQALGSCCQVVSNQSAGGSTTSYGVWMRHPTLKTNLICQLTDIANSEPASADSTAAGFSASNVTNWSSPGAGWSAADTNVGHYWTLDFGSVRSMNAILLKLPHAGVSYTYTIKYSSDDVNWTNAPVRAQNTANLQFQDSNAVANARYVRVQFTGLQSGYPAGLQAIWMY